MEGRLVSDQLEILEIRGNAPSRQLGTSKAKGLVCGGPNGFSRVRSMNETTPSPCDRLVTQLAVIPACQYSHDGADWFPPVDIVEDAGDYLFKIDLPEVKPENLQVAVEDDQLVISGERANPWQGESKVLRVERPYGYFARRFALPDDGDRTEISTMFAESVLEVRVRKVGSRMRPPAPTNAPPRLRLRAVT